MNANTPGESMVFAGTYTDRGSRGIYRFRFNAIRGVLTPDGVAAELPNPTFLCHHPNGRFLYALSETRDSSGRWNSAVNAFAIDGDTGRLTPLNTRPSGGAGPCHVCIDHTGSSALVANYAAGSVAMLPIGADGRLSAATDVIHHHGAGIDPERQEGPHAHSITPSPDNRFALVADLGLDRIMVYRMDAVAGRLWPNDPPWVAVRPGAGPRHLAFHPNRALVYAITEMGNSVITFAWDAARGVLTELATVSTLPPAFAGVSYAAEIACDSTGSFLYASNRGHDSLAVFALDAMSGLPLPIAYEPAGGRHPRHFAIHSSGRWLLTAHRDSDAIVIFTRNPATGRLAPHGATVPVSMPVCLVIA